MMTPVVGTPMQCTSEYNSGVLERRGKDIERALGCKELMLKRHNLCRLGLVLCFHSRPQWGNNRSC